MRELTRIRDSYETRGENVERFEDAHRLLRMALTVGDIVRISSNLSSAAMHAYDRAVVFDGDDIERRFSVDEVALLADAVAAVNLSIQAGLSVDYRPRGEVGAYLAEEASLPKTYPDGEPDEERVFELVPDGSIVTIYPRMSLADFVDELPRFVAFLQKAASQKQEIAIVEG